MKGLSKKERTPLIYDTRTKEAYDGIKHFTITKREINEWSLTKSYTSEYIPIKQETNKSLEETYNAFIEQADILKKQSRGKINLYKAGTLQKASLSLFFYTIHKLKITPDPLKELETKWLINTNHGQMIYKEEITTGHSYDINSMYASIMRDVNFKIPIKQGTFMKITKAEFNELKYYQYGIYRVQIDNDGSINTRKMFRFNHNNYYTTIDLNMAKILGLKINLIEDVEYNFLSYGKGTTITGSILFKPFVDMVYKMRQDHKNKDFKKILNLLWGSLCASNISTFQYDITKDLDININIDTTRHTLINQFIKGDIIKIEYCKTDEYFKYNWIRFKPFLLALGRKKITDVIRPYLDNITYLNTDGFNSNIELTNINLGVEIGQLKYEGIV